MSKIFSIVAATLLLFARLPFPASAEGASCNATPEFHLLDFWIGEWDVVSGNSHGKDIVRKVISGCAVTEEWNGGPGDTGMSLFYFNVYSKKWTQVWVSNAATSLGGMKEKVFVGRPAAGAVRFQGVLPGTDHGAPILDRTTLTPLSARRVHQRIEISKDGGATWRVTFDATYTAIKQ